MLAPSKLSCKCVILKGEGKKRGKETSKKGWENGSMMNL